MHFEHDVLMGIMADLDEETQAHSKRVQSLAVAIGERMGLTSAELKELNLGAYIHDIGEKFIPETILKKKAPLTPQEWEIIEMHPKRGYSLVEALGLSDAVKGIVLGHHLWADGQGGYPQELVGLKPSLLTQITTVADVFDAMISHRAYRQGLGIAAAMDHLKSNSGTRFNIEVVAVFEAEVYPSLRISG